MKMSKKNVGVLFKYNRDIIEQGLASLHPRKSAYAGLLYMCANYEICISSCSSIQAQPFLGLNVGVHMGQNKREIGNEKTKTKKI
jgi:hypothetical protein